MPLLQAVHRPSRTQKRVSQVRHSRRATRSTGAACYKRAHSSSSVSFFSAFLAMHWKAASTLMSSLADVSK